MGAIDQFWDVDSADNGISDGYTFISYREIIKKFEYLEHHFCIENEVKSCVFIEVQNTIQCAVMLLYLINKNINVFIASPNTLSSGTVPAFCDKILQMKDEGTSGFLESNLSPNAGHQKRALMGDTVGMVVLASSGSSSAPKYIYYKASKIVKNADACVQHFNIRADTKILVSVPIAHMYGLGAGFLPGVIAGASVVVINKPNIIKLISRLKSFFPHLCLINPILCKMLLQTNKKPQPVLAYISAGEPLDIRIKNEFTQRYGRLINLYGCSELGAMATSGVNVEESLIMDESLLRPIDGVEFKIEATSNGSEILCKSQYGFEFYLNEYGENINEQFFAKQWYHTNDAGYLDEDGNLKVVGRIDCCINRSGFLLALEELEFRLGQLLARTNGIVAIETDSKELVVYIELPENSMLDLSAVRSLCLQHLPRHAIPDNFYFLSDIPRLFNGKPDRIQLKLLHKTN
jgi:acyl-coenzyme A synthetase/AMP-(fatty) acid ligase